MVIWRMTVRLIVVLVLATVATPVAGMAADGTVAFSPEVSYVTPQQVFDVDLHVDDALVGTHCYMVEIEYDRGLLELLSIAEGPWLQSYGGTFFFWEGTETGCLLGICLLGNGLFGDGPGVMATLNFRSLMSTGTSVLGFSSVEFTDVDLEPISVIPLDGLVLIGEGQCCHGRVGDANLSGEDEPTIGDISIIVDAKFIRSSCDGLLDCLAEADINQSGGISPTCDDISIGDISTLVDYLFITGPPAYSPLPDCF